jgi:hypothetical protein
MLTPHGQLSHGHKVAKHFEKWMLSFLVVALTPLRQ